MGRLLTTGILGGHRVTLGLEGQLCSATMPQSIAQGWLKQLGFARVAGRILDQHELTVEEIATLVAEAPLAVLSYLVHQLGRDGGIGVVRPIVALPQSLIAVGSAPETEVPDLVNSILEHLPTRGSEELQVVVPGLNLSVICGKIGKALAVVCQLRPEVVVVGPSPEEIISWGPSSGEIENKLPQRDWFIFILATLRAIGVRRLRATRDLELLRDHTWEPFVMTVCTAIDGFMQAREIAVELQRLEFVGQSRGGIDVWFPGLSRTAPRNRYASAALDLALLRVLAVGTICCPSIRHRRATSRYLSLSALQFAPRCGANEFGFGAIDEHAAQVLSISKMAEIHGALGLASQKDYVSNVT